MTVDKSKFDKKTIFTLIAFVAVGILLFFTIFAHNGNLKNEKAEENSDKPNIKNNVAISKDKYYGKEVVNLAGTVYDKNGEIVDLSEQTEAIEVFEKNGKKLNLPTISSEEYAALKKGMSYEEICKIIGGKGEIIGEVDNPGDEFYTAAYFFYGDKAETSATFVFQGDRLKSKANTDLE